MEEHVVLLAWRCRLGDKTLSKTRTVQIALVGLRSNVVSPHGIVVWPIEQTLLWDRHKLREVGPGILKYCYQLNNKVSVLCFYSATDCIISDYLGNKTVLKCQERLEIASRSQTYNLTTCGTCSTNFNTRYSCSRLLPKFPGAGDFPRLLREWPPATFIGK